MTQKILTPAEYAEKLGISIRRVQVLCSEGRIKGARKHSGVWLIPANAQDPRKPEGYPKGKTRK